MVVHDNDEAASRLEWAVQIAREAGDGTLRHFRRADLRVERKADDSPVTVADREAEELLRKRIAERFPEDGVIGEEFGIAEGTSGYQWVLDPIDGTKSFVHGVPLYTTLVAVLKNGTALIGVIDAAATGETVYAATGAGCWYLPERDAKPQSAKVSSVARLNDALLVATDVSTFSTARKRDAREAWIALERATRLTRTWGDGYGYLLVATGRAEVMIDAVMNLWDAATMLPILTEAGGRFTDWRGEPTVQSGEGIATNGLVAEEVLAIVRGW
jgi:histidinol-phosphatase